MVRNNIGGTRSASDRSDTVICFVPNVTFPCATIHDAATGRIAVYYGAADSYVGLAFTTVYEVVSYIKEHSAVR